MTRPALNMFETHEDVGEIRHYEGGLWDWSISDLINLSIQTLAATSFLGIERRSLTQGMGGWHFAVANNSTPEVLSVLSVFDLVRDAENTQSTGAASPAGLSNLKLSNPAAAQRIQELAELKWDWDGEEGRPVTQEAINVTAGLILQAMSLQASLPTPFIAPLSDGGLQIEWRANVKGKLILVITPEGDDTEYVLDVPYSSGETEEYDGFVDTNGMSLDRLIEYLV